MHSCVICRFAVETDDVAVPGAHNDRCICVRCWNRETGAQRPMSKALRRELIVAAGPDTD